MSLPPENILKDYTFAQVKALLRETKTSTIKKKYQLPIKHEVIELNFHQRSLINKNK